MNIFSMVFTNPKKKKNRITVFSSSIMKDDIKWTFYDKLASIGSLPVLKVPLPVLKMALPVREKGRKEED